MCSISKLSLIASRLLNLLFLYGDAFNDWPKTKQMEAVGTSRPGSFREARLELERFGMVELRNEPGRQARLFLSPATRGFSLSSAVPRSLPPLMQNEVLVELHSELLPNRKEGYVILGGSLNGSTGGFLDGGSFMGSTESVLGCDEPSTESVPPGLSGDTESVLPTHLGSAENVLPGLMGDAESVPTGLLGSTESVPGYGGEEQHGTESVPGGEMGLIERCREVDEMDASGSETSTKSPFGLRRIAQIPLVQEAYRTHFPQDSIELNPRNAKQWLGWCNNRAEDVVDALQDIAERKPGLTSPVTYIRKVLQGEKERGAQVVARSTGGAVSSAVPSPARPLLGELQPPSPEYMALVKRREAAFEQWKAERGLPE